MRRPLTPVQKKVFEEAKTRLKSKPWFSGVCVDDFPEDKEIEKDFEGAVMSVVMLTEWWDGPTHLYGE